MNKTLDGLIHFFMYAILAFTLFSFFICIIVFSVKYQDVFSLKEGIWLLPAVLFFGFVFYITERVEKSNVFILAMVLAQLIIAVVMIFAYDTKPVSDYAAIWESAQEMAKGSFSSGLVPATYMYVYNWQLGITAFEALGISLGMNFFAFKILNALLVCLFCFFEYHLVRRKCGERAANVAYAVSTFFLPWILTIPQFTNHHIGLGLILIILYLLEKNNWQSWCGAGLLTAVLNVLRPMGIIIALTAIAMAIYKCIAKRAIKPGMKAVLFVVVYSICLSIFNMAFVKADYTDIGISEARIPYYKFQKGLYGYNTPAEDLIKYDYDIEKYNEAMREQLKDELTNNPIQTCVFVANKMVRYLGLFDYQFEMTFNHDATVYTKYPIKALYCMGWFQYVLIVAMALFGYREYERRNGMDVYQIFFIGNTIVYVFIEAFSSYRFESYTILIMLAADGAVQLFRCGLKKNRRLLMKC